MVSLNFVALRYAPNKVSSRPLTSTDSLVINLLFYFISLFISIVIFMVSLNFVALRYAPSKVSSRPLTSTDSLVINLLFYFISLSISIVIFMVEVIGLEPMTLCL